jgi:uncharacterized membrane protein YdjX (TVP38/TMEM64 family)
LSVCSSALGVRHPSSLQPLKTLLAFLNNLDARASRTLWVSAVMVAAVVALIVVGKTSGVFGTTADTDSFLAGLRDSPWGLPATVLLFCAGAFLAAPQFMLIGAVVLTFGPVEGTLVSGVLTFFTGRMAGADILRRYGGRRANRLSRFIGRNDFLASLVVRNVPSAPFIVVNMAFGVSHASFLRFLAGMAIGIVPKTLLIALLGQSAATALGGAPLMAAALVLAVAGIWLTVTMMARRAVAPEGDGQVASPDSGLPPGPKPGPVAGKDGAA